MTAINLFRPQLADALRALRSVAGARAALPVLAHIALDARDGVLTLSATSLEAWGVRRIPYSGDNLSTTVNAKQFADYAANFTGDAITLELDKNKLRLTSGKSKASLSTIDRDEFPVIPDTSDGTQFEIDGDTLARIVARTVPFAATDESRPILTGVSLRVQAGLARFAAADNYRIGIVTLALPDVPDCECVLPAKSLALVGRVVEDATLRVRVGASTALFEGSDGELTTRLVQGNYPNIEAVTAGDKQGGILFARDGFADAVKLSGLTGALISKLSTTSEGLRIESSDGDTAFEQVLDATVGVEGEAKVAINTKYAASVASALSDSREMELLYGGPLSPAEFRDPADATFRCIVMPVRTGS